MGRAFIVFLGFLVVFAAQSSSVLAQPNAMWRLPANQYPPHTRIIVAKPTNPHAQQIFGRAHKHRYAVLGRESGHGWLQGGSLNIVLTETVGGHPQQVKHLISWLYLVSYFSDAEQATAAVADLKPGVPPAVFGDLGRFGHVGGAGNSVVSMWYDIKTRGNVVFEELCVTDATAAQRFRGLINRYRAQQHAALQAILAKAVPSPPAS